MKWQKGNRTAEAVERNTYTGSVPSGEIENMPRADELTAEQLKDFARNYRLICLLETGTSAREALQRLAQEFKESPRSARWARKLYARYGKDGAQGLLDGRRSNKSTKHILTVEVKELVLAWWYARSAAGPKAIWKKVVEDCSARNLPAPGYDAVRKYLKGLSEHDKLVRAGKVRVYDKQHRPVARFNLTTYSNERWQIDHSRLNFWIREWRHKARINGAQKKTKLDLLAQENKGAGWQPCEVWLTVVLDAHSRAIAGFHLSTACPDAWTTALLLRVAVLPKENPLWRNRGLPSVLQPDRGRDFLSHAVQASLGYLGIICDPDPPYYPDRKGRIERFFRTLDTGCLRPLPGHMDAIGVTHTAAEKHLATLLTWRQLAEEIERWIVTDYHARTHSETGRTPAQMWEETVRLRMPQSEDALDNLLLKSDKARRVRNTGIDFHIGGKSDAGTRGGRYWAPELAYYAGCEVRVRYNPEDLDSILAYDAATGEYICEAWVMGQDDSRYTIADIKRSRSQHRRGLIERMKTYAEEIHREDRRKARQDEWEAARALADEQPAATAPGAATAKTPDGVNALLAEFERRDRGIA